MRSVLATNHAGQHIPDHGLLMPETKPDWRIDRPLEGFYTTYLPTRPGLPVRTFLPTDYQPQYPYPLVVLLHGHGGTEEHTARLAPSLSRRNYICISPRGPVNLGPHTDGRSAFSWVGCPDTQIENHLREAIECAQRTYTIHANRIYLIGEREGADVAYRVALRMRDSVAGIVALNGRVSARMVGVRGLRVLMGHGSANPVVPHAAAQRDFRRLAAAGADVRFLSYPTTQKIHPDMLRDVNRWIMGSIAAEIDSPMKD